METEVKGRMNHRGELTETLTLMGISWWWYDKGSDQWCVASNSLVLQHIMSIKNRTHNRQISDVSLLLMVRRDDQSLQASPVTRHKSHILLSFFIFQFQLSVIEILLMPPPLWSCMGVIPLHCFLPEWELVAATAFSAERWGVNYGNLGVSYRDD